MVINVIAAIDPEQEIILTWLVGEVLKLMPAIFDIMQF
jgi:hypothetical protein